jgi:hypothetical protein
MGEGKEQQPLALISDAPIDFISKVNKKELIINPREDIYQPLFERIKKVIVNMSEKDHEENFDQLLGIRQSNGEFKWSE